jgi:hypothetical protein
MDKNPTVDPAEENAFFPSPYSLTKYTASKTDFDGLSFNAPYRGGKWRVLMIATDERYLLMKNDKFVITLCHGPACLLAAAVDEPEEHYIYKGYKLCVFPDSLDTGANLDIGYIPGPMPWLVGEKLQALGVGIVNAGITGQCHQDRKLITGDSPLASNKLGKLAADALLQAAGA